MGGGLGYESQWILTTQLDVMIMSAFLEFLGKMARYGGMTY